MKYRFVLLVTFIAIHWFTNAQAVVGDLNRNGVVDFEDFFIFADNFGKEGSPEIIDTVKVAVYDTLKVTTQDTIEVTVYDTLVVEIENVVYDTLVIDRATVFDTITYGMEPIRYDPPPPSDEITQALAISAINYFNVRIFNYLMGELQNKSTASVEDVGFRLTVRDNDGFVVNTQQYSYEMPFLVAGDTRPFQLSLPDDIDFDLIRSGNYTLEIRWENEVQKVNNVTVQLDTEKIRYGNPFKITGEIKNPSDLTVDSFELVFLGKDTNGKCIYYQQFSEDDFGILPGGTAPFSIDEVALDYGGPYTQRSDIDQLWYYINWKWTDSDYFDREVSPYTRLF